MSNPVKMKQIALKNMKKSMSVTKIDTTGAGNSTLDSTKVLPKIRSGIEL